MNGARIRLEPEISREVNEPEKLKKILVIYEKIAREFSVGGKFVSVADLIVLGGDLGIEIATKRAGHDVVVPFKQGRMDAAQEEADVRSINFLEPRVDGFRNYIHEETSSKPEVLLVDKAQISTLTAPEMTVLLGGLRVLGNNYGGSKNGVLTDKSEALTNDFFVNLLDMSTE